MEQNLPQDVAAEKRLLLVTRMLGHKDDIPGSGRWRIYTKPFKGRNDCWVCDHHIYSLIFWNELVGLVELRKYSAADAKYIVSRVKEMNNEKDDEDVPLLLHDPDAEDGQAPTPVVPTIYGECTNWEPR